jgi:uncharacterized protein YbaP (TraB family)
MMLRPLLLLAVALAACAPEATARPITATPALWVVRDADTEIVLLGAIHVLPDSVAWRGGRVGRAIARADTLVLEVGDIADPQAQSARFLALGRSDALPPVGDRVPAELRGELARIAGDTGPPIASLDRLKSWAAAVALGGGMWRDIGASREDGVDSVLADIFIRAKKPIVGLETADAQFALFDSLSEADQRVLLARAIVEGRDPKARFAAMLDAWAKGDTDAIAATFGDTMRASPSLADALLGERNAAWADWIARRMDTPGRVLIAVGAGHLAGAGSVQERLQAKGLTVARVQ